MLTRCVTTEEQQLSPLRYFYDSEKDRDPTQDGCKRISAQRAKEGFDKMLDEINGIGGYFLSSKAEEEKFTNKTRSNILLGTPLPGFKDKDDSKDTQGLLYDMFYEGLDCKAFSKELEKGGIFEKYKGVNPCKDKKDDFKFDGIETMLMKEFDLKGIPAEDGPLGEAGSLRSGYMFADPQVATDDGLMQVRFWSLAFQQVEFNRVVNSDLLYTIASIQVCFLFLSAYRRAGVFCRVCVC